MRIRREVVGALCALLVTACAAAAAGPEDGASPTVPTIVGGVGVLPEPLSTVAPAVDSASTVPAPSDALDTATVATTSPGTTTTAFVAPGNRVLMLGDSILASTAHRHSNDSCKALVPLGWKVEVEAEVSRGIDFGNIVLAQRKKAGWDVGVVLLGTNNGTTDANIYLSQLNKIITTFAPSPVVLITVSEFRPEIKAINNTIRSIAQVYPDQVSIIDWNAMTQQRPELLNVDGIHPTVQGRAVLAQAIADHLGTAPAAPGECLPSSFTDDSAGSVDGNGGSGGTNTTVKPRTTPTTAPGSGTTVKPGGTPTTVKPGSTTTIGAPATTTGSSGSGPTTVPATYGTLPPQTTAAPPTTAAPQTTVAGP